MATPYVGEIRLFAGGFAPSQWAFCDGSLVSINENTTLFALLGTTYGGDGQTTFALPDLRSRVPIGQGAGTGLSQRVMGQSGGQEVVTLTTAQLPSHTHTLLAGGTATTSAPAGATFASGDEDLFAAATSTTAVLAPQTVGSSGGGQPHDNLAPYLAVNYIISLYGIYPSQS